jgi:hypothetical protein
VGPGIGALRPGQCGRHHGHCGWWDSILLGINGLFQGLEDFVALSCFELKAALSRDTAPARLKGKGHLWHKGKRVSTHQMALLLSWTFYPKLKPCGSSFPPPGTIQAFFPPLCFSHPVCFFLANRPPLSSPFICLPSSVEFTSKKRQLLLGPLASVYFSSLPRLLYLLSSLLIHVPLGSHSLSSPGFLSTTSCDLPLTAFLSASPYSSSLPFFHFTTPPPPPPRPDHSLFS